MKVCYTLLLLVCSVISLKAQTITSSVIAPPSQLSCSDVPVRLNNVVFGSIPLNAQDNPVVVFVHGWFDDGYGWFMAKNKWYEDAYNAGYRTAFFFQSYSGAFEDNGRVIAAMIRETCRHYNTDKVVAICHSKGGYDIEYALYNENVWDSVQGVITLSTPFWGAPMSDMIAIPFIRTFLESVPIVGPIFQGKGSYQMQTAYMAGVVRPMMDNHPNNRPEKFHCFAAWGKDHHSVFPPNVPDDILKIIFPDFQPVCTDIPGFGNFAGDLISSGMSLIGDLSHLVQVQPEYDNPQKNQVYLDGLAPYYSSLRPGSVEISEAPPATSSYLNHIDVLLSSEMWNVVQPEIEYFKHHPVFRQQAVKTNSTEAAPATVRSDLQCIQNTSIQFTNVPGAKVFLAGQYLSGKIEVFDEQQRLVKTIPLDMPLRTLYEIFHPLDLSGLDAGKSYTLKSSVPLAGFLRDGKPATIALDTHSDKTFYADEALGLQVTLQDWPDNIGDLSVKGYLNRNMDVQGEPVKDKLIPIRFSWDAASASFVCKDQLSLPEGVYNVSVFADGPGTHRFATSSILLKQARKQLAADHIDLTVFPNPSADLFIVRWVSSRAAAYHLKVLDVTGKEVAEQNLGWQAAGNVECSISAASAHLAKGTYYLSVLRDGERIAAKLIAVQ